MLKKSEGEEVAVIRLLNSYSTDRPCCDPDDMLDNSVVAGDIHKARVKAFVIPAKAIWCILDSKGFVRWGKQGRSGVEESS